MGGFIRIKGYPNSQIPFQLPEVDFGDDYELESTYIHDHLKSIATEITKDFKENNENKLYQLYKTIAEGQITNPPIIVTKEAHTIAKYDIVNKQIIIREDDLIDIKDDNDKKLQLINALANAYSDYINGFLKKESKTKKSLKNFDHNILRFDGINDNVVIGKLISPNYSGDIVINCINRESSKKSKWEKSGPGASVIEIKDYNLSSNNKEFNESSSFVLSFGFDIKEGFTASSFNWSLKDIERTNEKQVLSIDSIGNSQTSLNHKENSKLNFRKHDLSNEDLLFSNSSQARKNTIIKDREHSEQVVSIDNKEAIYTWMQTQAKQ